jgi:hypothetical protein
MNVPVEMVFTVDLFLEGVPPPGDRADGARADCEKH